MELSLLDDEIMNKVFKPKAILITGGTGSFGRQFVADVLERYPDLERLVIFSRDELDRMFKRT